MINKLRYLQMGHLLVLLFKSLQHSVHIHICLQGSIIEVTISAKHIEHSFYIILIFKIIYININNSYILDKLLIQFIIFLLLIYLKLSSIYLINIICFIIYLDFLFNLSNLN